jgi:hypothetical protein
MLPKRLAERPGLLAPHVIQVPLRLAVVEPEARRVAAVAGRCIPMPNQCYVTAFGQRRPRFVGAVTGQTRRSHQQDGENRCSKLTGHLSPPLYAHDIQVPHWIHMSP